MAAADCETKVYHILNLGAGVQSTTVYLLALAKEEGVPWFDAAIFADTQEEPENVYKHLAWLQQQPGPPIWVRTAGKLGDDLISGRNSTGQNFASIPAYTAQDHTIRPAVQCNGIGRIRRQCTAEYKIEVVERAIRRELLGRKPRQRVPKGILVKQYFGISCEEQRRASNIQKRFEKLKWAEPVFPLLEKRMTRQSCQEWLKSRVPHVVPRSACVFCPFKSDEEWLRLKREDPAGWARAVEVDEALRKPGSIVNRDLDQKLYVHRKAIPLAMVDLEKSVESKAKQLDLFNFLDCGEGMCGV